MATTKRQRAREPVRWAVVGIGHIAQVAVLPAFSHAGTKSRLAALVSGDPIKRRELGDRHGVPTWDYEDFERALAAEAIEAVYVGLPNDQHCEFTERAAAAGVHVLCEKPMAPSLAECERMNAAAARAGVQLMIAYRLHFEAATLKALALAESGALGEPRLFDSTFSMQVRADNVRVDRAKGGGPLLDLGVYCIQAARLLFGADPIDAYAAAVRGDDPRFREIDEAVSAVLRFPGERLATFTCSFGAADVSSYRIVGTEAELRVEPAYEYVGALVHHLTRDGKQQRRTFARRDQFAPELQHFAECVRRGETPEPSGVEGMIDVAIVEALEASIATGARVALPAFPRERRPTPRQVRHFRAVRKPALVHAQSGSQ
jgi:predicted dehydrogenase